MYNCKYLTFFFQVAGARMKLKDIGAEMENLKKLAFNMVSLYRIYHLDSIDCQSFSCANVNYCIASAGWKVGFHSRQAGKLIHI